MAVNLVKVFFLVGAPKNIKENLVFDKKIGIVLNLQNTIKIPSDNCNNTILYIKEIERHNRYNSVQSKIIINYESPKLFVFACIYCLH